MRKNIKILLTITIITIILLVGVIINLISNNKTQLLNKSQIIKEMSSSAQETELNNQINALNKEHTEYMNHIQTCKTSIATALTNEGVPTSNEAKLETMAENISKVLQARTADATATADNITEGKTAYVNGELIIGNGADNNSYYAKGSRVAYGYTGTMEPGTTATIPLDFTPEFVYIASNLYRATYNNRFVTGVRNDLYVSDSGQSNIYKYQYTADTGVIDSPWSATQKIIINENEIQIFAPTGPVDIFWIAVKCKN